MERAEAYTNQVDADADRTVSIQSEAMQLLHDRVKSMQASDAELRGQVQQLLDEAHQKSLQIATLEHRVKCAESAPPPKTASDCHSNDRSPFVASGRGEPLGAKGSLPLTGRCRPRP